MKKITALYLLVIAFSIGCNKSSSSSSSSTLATNSIEFHVDGAKQSYSNAYATIGIGSMTGLHLLTVGSNDMFPNTIQVKVFDTAAITTKTYLSSSSSDQYISTFYGAYQTRQLYPNGYIKITSITSTNVQGEFIDSVYKYSDNTWKVVKQGKFNVNF